MFKFFFSGLRVLPEDDARSLMNAIRNVLQNKTLNPFVFNPSNVRILSGEEEGVFAWITINYLKDYFGSDRLVQIVVFFMNRALLVNLL